MNAIALLLYTRRIAHGRRAEARTADAGQTPAGRALPPSVRRRFAFMPKRFRRAPLSRAFPADHCAPAPLSGYFSPIHGTLVPLPVPRLTYTPISRRGRFKRAPLSRAFPADHCILAPLSGYFSPIHGTLVPLPVPRLTYTPISRRGRFKRAPLSRAFPADYCILAPLSGYFSPIHGTLVPLPVPRPSARTEGMKTARPRSLKIRPVFRAFLPHLR